MKLNKYYSGFLLKFFFRSAFFLVLACLFSGCSPSRHIQNPYSTVVWSHFGQYKANLHTHTTVRGGWMNPQTTVGKYREAGYRILAITDHFSVTYPWERFSMFKPEEKIKQRILDKVPKPQESEPMLLEELEYKDVIPSAAGMVAVQGNEISYQGHDVNSFYNNYDGNNSKESLDSITEKNGIAVLNHPGRYKFPAGWYADLFRRYNKLIGIEVFNCGNRYPNDRRLWDSIITLMAPFRPVWGFSNDDLHSMRDFGRNWNVFLLPELNEQQVRKAMESGIFYFVNAPKGQTGSSVPVIGSIKVSQRKSEIKIHASNCDSIVWCSSGKILGKGSRITCKNQPDELFYIRAELYGEANSIVCTQPFIITKTPPKKM